MSIYERINQSVEYIKSKYQKKPKIGLILGSGLGEYVDGIENKTKNGRHLNFYRRGEKAKNKPHLRVRSRGLRQFSFLQLKISKVN